MKKEADAVFVDPTPRLYLQASLSAAKGAHGQNNHGACHKLQLHPHHWEQNMQQVVMLKNGIPQGSVLASLLYNMYTYDLPTSTSQKYTYTNNIAFINSARDRQTI